MTGSTVTCTIPVARAGGIYDPDTVDPVIPGPGMSDLCFGAATVTFDPSRLFNQQLTLVS